MKNEWLYHLASLQFQTWAQYRETRNSLEHPDPVNHDIYLGASHWWTVPSSPDESNRYASQSTEPGNHPESHSSSSRALHWRRRYMPSMLLFLAFVQGKVCAEHTFPNNSRDSSSFHIFNSFAEKGVWQYRAWTWEFISGTCTVISLRPYCTPVGGHFLLKA